ncbi:glycosyltransferase [Vibrio splendidus]|uniref:glycosyltransferase n=1 Tax=Vibrio splendidus TaxID=29497 RepID=UPI000D351536|nr:glycosyltransferase [Vibrio splendidus]PTO58116.1 glycosyltransferase [Vibrio splendidus]
MINNKVLMFIRTPSLMYDDRVRKEAKLLSSKGSVYISSYENRIDDLGTSYENISIKRHTLTLRKIFGSGVFPSIKLFEMYLRFLFDYLRTKPNIIWLHNFEAVGLVGLFLLVKKIFKKDIKIVWDQHEMPPNIILSNSVFKKIYKIFLNKIDVNIHACSARAEYINVKLDDEIEHMAIENFPDKSFIKTNNIDIPLAISQWLDGQPLILCQGGCRSDRAYESIVKSAIKAKKKIVFVGPIIQPLVDEVRHDNIDFDLYIYMQDSVPQMHLKSYICSSILTLVFYKKNKINNWLCAPNRFYQSLSLGTPVICGNNPLFTQYSDNPLVRVVGTDGSDSVEIYNTLVSIDNMSEKTKMGELVFESQSNKIIKEIFG